MAKLRGKAKAAFLRRMARGRRKAGRKTGRSRGGRKRRNPRRWKWTPGRRRAFAKMLAAGGRGRRPRRSTKSRKAASRRRLTRTATTMEMVPVRMADLVKNPRKRRKSTMAKRRRRHRRSNPRRHRRRLSPIRHHRRRRRHNPAGVSGAAKALMHAAIPAAAGGALAAIADAKLSNMSTVLRIGGKLVVAGIGGALLRKNPVRAAAFIGAMVGTAAHEGTIRAMGGVLAPSKPAGIKELAAMAAEDEQSMALLQEELQGMGLLEEGTSGMGDPEPSLGDLEPSLGDEGTTMEDLADELTE